MHSRSQEDEPNSIFVLRRDSRQTAFCVSKRRRRLGSLCACARVVLGRCLRRSLAGGRRLSCCARLGRCKPRLQCAHESTVLSSNESSLRFARCTQCVKGRGGREGKSLVRARKPEIQA